MSFSAQIWKLVLGVFLVFVPVFSKQYGIFEITSKNYQTLVMDGGKDAWIVAVKDAGKISTEKWKDLEYNLRGLFVRVGIIDPNKDGAFLKKNGFLQKDRKYFVARVFPYGGYKIKAAGKMDVKSLKEAEKAVLESLPDETTKIKNMEDLQKYVAKGYAAVPLKMPVLLLTDKRVTTPLLRAITMKYSRYFNFGVVRKPSQEITQNFQVKQIPTILVMIGTKGTHNGKQIIKFSSVFYDVKLYGGISYLNLTTFFYSVHEKHWAEHPDAKKYKGELGLKEFFVEDVREILARDADVFSEKDGNDALEIETGKGSEAIEITSANHKRICTDSALGLCLIYFLDAKSERYLKNALKLYKDLTQMPKMKDKPLHYLWVNGTCHPEYGDIFGISPDNLPVLLLAKPKRRLFKTLRGDLTGEEVSEVVSQIFLGQEDLSPFSRFNDMLSIDCHKTEATTKPAHQVGSDSQIKGKASRKAKDKQEASVNRKTERAEEL